MHCLSTCRKLRNAVNKNHVNAVCRGGLRFGALAGLFYAVQQISSIARAEKGLPDTVAGGTAAGAVFGATGEDGHHCMPISL